MSERFRRMRRLLPFVLAVVATAHPAWAQGRDASVRVANGVGAIAGTVVDARTSAPIGGVLVECRDTGHVAVSAEDGTFQLDGVQVGHRALYVSVVGYALARPLVEVIAGQTVHVTVPLAEGTGAYTERVTVTAQDTLRPTLAPATQLLTSAGLQDLRGVLADDPLRAVQAMPSVAAGDDFRSEFSIRGSDFRHLGLSIDGVASRWLVHTVRGVEDTGSVSLINGDVLDRISLLSGSYPQRFGDRTGAWVESEIRDGSRAARAMRGSLSGTGASLVAEAPFGSRRQGSWLVSIRQSYLDWLLRQITDDAVVFGFTDMQAKAAYDMTDRQRLALTFIGGRSRLSERNTSPGPNTLEEGTSRTGILMGHLRSTIGATVVLDNRLAIIGSHFKNRGFFDQRLVGGQATEGSHDVRLTWSASPRALVELGTRTVRERVGVTRHQYVFVQARPSPVERRVDHFAGTAWRSSAVGGIRWTTSSGFALHPGVMVTRHSLTRETNVAPWFTASWPIHNRAALRAGTGVMQQAPEIEQVLGPSGDLALGSESAHHVDLAMDLRLGQGTLFSVAAYQREERNFIRLEGAEPRLVGSQLVFGTTTQFRNALRGTARGLEMTLRRDSTGGLSGWVSYSLGRLRYNDRLTGESFWGDFDQRHAANLYGLYRVSPRMSVSAKLRLGSNFPLTGYFERRNEQLFAGRTKNTERLPLYSRLDVRANRTFNYAKRRLTLFFEVLNLLNRTNFGPTDGDFRVRTAEAFGFVEELLPILPSAGLTIEF